MAQLPGGNREWSRAARSEELVTPLAAEHQAFVELLQPSDVCQHGGGPDHPDGIESSCCCSPQEISGLVKINHDPLSQLQMPDDEFLEGFLM
jgi:hypothetical protein